MSTPELPIVPFDGMKFTDSWRRQWEYSAETITWIFKGFVPNVPLADESTIGLLSSELKSLLNSVPEKAGGFGILTKFSFGKVSGYGISGLMTGDIVLKSNTLDIKCRDLNGKLITKTCPVATSSPEIDKIPSIDINFSELFLDTLCIEVPGSKGPKGVTGPDGPDGDDGFGDGPQGKSGKPGNDATGISVVDQLVVEIDESFYDTAVVGVELDQQKSILSVTKAKLAVPDDSTPADRLVVMPIVRSLKWNDGLNYEIIAPDNENMDLEPDVGVLAYPIDFNPELVDGDTEISRKALSDFVNQIIGSYKIIFDKYLLEYDQEIKDFIFKKDDEARKVLDSLVAQLAAKQFSETFEYCMGLADNGVCGQQLLDAFNSLIVLIDGKIATELAAIALNTSAIADCVCRISENIEEGGGGGNVTPVAIEDFNNYEQIAAKISDTIQKKTNSNGYEYNAEQNVVITTASFNYTSDICNYAKQILEASGEVTYGDVCPGIQSKLLAKVEIVPGTKYYIKNGVGGVELPRGAYIIQYKDGTVYNKSQPDCGYIVGSGVSDRGLVMNIENSESIVKVPMPMSSQITDPHNKNGVINAYLTGPITEMAIGAFADDNDKIYLEIAGDKDDLAGSISVYIKYCARCDQ